MRKNKRVSILQQEAINCLAPSLEDSYKDLDIHYALNQLPTMYREIIILRFFEDLKLEEIAKILQIPLSTVKSRLYHALKLLKISFTEQDEELE